MTAMKVKEEGKAHGQKQSDSGEEMAVYVLMGGMKYSQLHEISQISVCFNIIVTINISLLSLLFDFFFTNKANMKPLKGTRHAL